MLRVVLQTRDECSAIVKSDPQAADIHSTLCWKEIYFNFEGQDQSGMERFHSAAVPTVV